MDVTVAIKLNGTNAWIVGTIHDEIIVECQDEKAEYYEAFQCKSK